MYICFMNEIFFKLMYRAVSIYCLILVSCGGGSVVIPNVDTSADISKLKGLPVKNIKSAEKIIKDYTIEFKIPNPLIDSGSSFRRIDPNHEDTILCWATLLDDISTEADIVCECSRDSLDLEECNSFRDNYKTEKIRDGMFRIRITMESGFSPKSMDPKHWVIYIENSKGIVIEPADIVTSHVTSHDDSIFSDYHKISLPRNLLKRTIELYYNQTTFFGEDLLSSKNPFIVLVFTREKKTLSRVAWKISSEPIKK